MKARIARTEKLVLEYFVYLLVLLNTGEMRQEGRAGNIMAHFVRLIKFETLLAASSIVPRLLESKTLMSGLI